MHIDNVMEYLNDNTPLSYDEMREISKHGCMAAARPNGAVYYYNAAEAMMKYGEEIVEFIDSDIPGLDSSTSYRGWCCDVVSMAVELYCHLKVDEYDGYC